MVTQDIRAPPTWRTSLTMTTTFSTWVGNRRLEHNPNTTHIAIICRRAVPPLAMVLPVARHRRGITRKRARVRIVFAPNMKAQRRRHQPAHATSLDDVFTNSRVWLFLVVTGASSSITRISEWQYHARSIPPQNVTCIVCLSVCPVNAREIWCVSMWPTGFCAYCLYKVRNRIGFLFYVMYLLAF